MRLAKGVTASEAQRSFLALDKALANADKVTIEIMIDVAYRLFDMMNPDSTESAIVGLGMARLINLHNELYGIEEYDETP